MRRPDGRWRGLAIALGTALGFGLVGGALLTAMDRAGVSQPPSSLDVTAIVEGRLAALAHDDPRHELARVFVLGDSTSVPLPDRLQIALDAALDGRRVRVTSLVILGQTTFDQYFLSEGIARAGPDAVVIGLHLAGFSDSWRTAFPKPEFAGWLPLRRAFEALRLPLHWVGLSADEMFWYMAIVGTGQADAWRALVREQVRVGQAARDADRWLAATVGADDQRREFHAFASFERLIAPGPRFTRTGAQSTYGPVLSGLPADHPVLETLGALVSSFSSRGIATLVAVMPANVEHLGKLGLLEGSALPRSLATIESVARRAGASFLDLHDSLPDAAFVDAAGHYRPPATFDGPGLVASRLAPAVAALLAGKPD